MLNSTLGLGTAKDLTVMMRLERPDGMGQVISTTGHSAVGPENSRGCARDREKERKKEREREREKERERVASGKVEQNSM